MQFRYEKNKSSGSTHCQSGCSATGLPLCKPGVLFMKEIWKNINGWEGYYQVSNIGRVKRLAGSPRCFNDRILTIKFKKHGYAFVCLSKNRCFKYYHVHRLVAEAFIPNELKKPQINHKNMIKSDNNVHNLEWCTHSENQRHARSNIKYKLNQPKGVNHPKTFPVLQKDKSGKLLFLWECAELAANHYGVKSSAITTAIIRRKMSVGYKWQKVSSQFEFTNPKNYPPIKTTNVHTRDMSKAHSARKKNIRKIKKYFILNHGIHCFNEYGNIYRANWEEYARRNKTPGYGMTVSKFKTFKIFQNKVISKIQSPLAKINL